MESKTPSEVLADTKRLVSELEEALIKRQSELAETQARLDNARAKLAGV